MKNKECVYETAKWTPPLYLIIYQLERVEYSEGDNLNNKSLGYYSSLEKAINKAREENELNKASDPIVIYYPDRINSLGQQGLLTNLVEKETEYPYSGYIITEINVK